MTQNAYFSLITHTKQLLLVTFCDTTAGIGASFRTHGRTETRREEGQTDVEVEIVIQMGSKIHANLAANLNNYFDFYVCLYFHQLSSVHPPLSVCRKLTPIPVVV